MFDTGDDLCTGTSYTTTYFYQDEDDNKSNDFN